MIELTPIFDSQSGKALYIQLAEYIKKEILAGRIYTNERLPSKRKLAEYLGVSLNTIQAAYDQLGAEGYVESHPRKGLFVASIEHDVFMLPPLEKDIPKINVKELEINIDFNSGKVDLEHFPYAIWKKITIQSLYEDQGELFYIGNPQGEENLREQIAVHIYASRGVRCSADQIVIGAGTQALIGLLSMIIGNEHIYALENPGFHRARIVLQDQGVRTIPISLDEEGIDVHQLKMSDARVVYVTPSHQFPNGMIMPISRRMDLLKWAEEKNGYIIEDDYDGEYRYKGKPIPALQGLSANENVIYLGTFSKSLIPSIRIGYMVLPTLLLKKYQEHFTLYKQTVSRIHQDTLYRFMKEGYWQTHLNKMRTLYRKKQAALMLAITQYLGANVTVIGEKSGLHIVLNVKNNMTEVELVERAMAVGVKVYPLSVYFHGDTECGGSSVLLGFGGLTEAEINTGIKLLKGAWKL